MTLGKTEKTTKLNNLKEKKVSQFHSIVSRREFMKALGLAGAGIGATSVMSPASYDLDELISSPQSLWKRPWYVKQRDLYNPTNDVDWAS